VLWELRVVLHRTSFREAHYLLLTEMQDLSENAGFVTVKVFLGKVFCSEV